MEIALRLVAGEERFEIGYGEFWARIQATASHLKHLGVGHGDIILIFGQYGADMLLAFFAGQLLGAVPAFMPAPTARQDGALWACTHRELIQRLKPRFVLTVREAEHLVRLLDAPSVMVLDEVARPAGEYVGPELAHECSIDDIAFLQHSSGTTGLKKGVVVTYRQLRNQVDSYSAAVGLQPGHRVVSWLPIYHDMGLIAATLMPFSLALPVTWLETMSWLAAPQSFMDELAVAPGAVAWLPNFAFSYLAQRCRKPIGQDALRGVHAIINCSEACKAVDMERFRTRFSPAGLPEEAVQVCYAMAEYVFAVTQTPRRPGSGTQTLRIDKEAFDTEGRVLPVDAAGLDVVCVGRPINGVQIRIMPERDETDVGEVELTGPALCSGYYLNDAVTREKFVNGWYRSGDLGFIVEGRLYISGRKDDRLIVRGRNLYAHDIEAVVTSTGQIRAGRCVALGIDDANGTQQLVVIGERSDSTDGRSVALISERVFEMTGISPTEVLLVEPNTLIKTSSGKISRSQNAQRYGSGTLTRWVAAK